MKFKLKHYRLAILIIVLGWVACAKYKDETAAPLNLTNYYCNDPNAVNYNWGFPGIANDSVCYYPEDLYTGNWTMTDSVIRGDSTFVGIFSYTLQITSLNDSSKNRVSVAGLCTNGQTFNLLLDRYGNGATDSAIANYTNYQFLCSNADTLFGTFDKDYYDSNAIDINYTTITDTGTTYHFANAIRN